MATNGYAPDYGEAVERAVCRHYGMEYVDGEHFDARTSDGTGVQIKATRRTISNGRADRNGCFTVWSEDVLHGIADAGMFLAVIYDPDAWTPKVEDPEDADPETLLIYDEWIEPEDVGDAAADYWGEAHRPSKGDRARVPWDRLTSWDPEPLPEVEEAALDAHDAQQAAQVEQAERAADAASYPPHEGVNMRRTDAARKCRDAERQAMTDGGHGGPF